jgi:hypothetical protein
MELISTKLTAINEMISWVKKKSSAFPQRLCGSAVILLVFVLVISR